MSKKNNWIESWCRTHLNELEKYRGLVVAVHKDHGIINASRDMLVLKDQARFLKKKLVPDVAYIYTADYLLPLGEKREEDDDVFPSFGDPQPPTVKKGPLDVEDQGPVPEKMDPPTPLSDPFDNSGIVLDGTQPEAETKNPFSSPDKQPPFQPRSSPAFDRGILIDGGGAGYRRSLRVD